jgi:alpha-beta hydrolase superfamily lysophospholipase
MPSMASLVQDVWLGWEPRLRGRRLAPWEEPAVRLLFHLDLGASLDEPPVAAFLESLADTLEVVAWEPRGTGGSGGRPDAEVLDDVRRLAQEAGPRFGPLPLVVGGHGLGGWLALAVAGTPGVAGAFALAPALGGAARPAPEALRTAIADALASVSPGVPALVVEGRDRPAGEASVVSQWLERNPAATRVAVAGADDAVFVPPWPEAVAAWVGAVGRAARS